MANIINFLNLTHVKHIIALILSAVVVATLSGCGGGGGGGNNSSPSTTSYTIAGTITDSLGSQPFTITYLGSNGYSVSATSSTPRYSLTIDESDIASVGTLTVVDTQGNYFVDTSITRSEVTLQSTAINETIDMKAPSSPTQHP